LGTNFKAWIFKILFNLGANELRKVKHREKMASRLAEEALRSGKNVAGNDRRNAAVDWERQYPELVDDGEKMALDNLNENQRKVFMRVLLGGLSYRECAHEMNIPLGTVMSRLFRARNQLSAELPLPPLTNVRRPAKTVKCGEIARTATSMR
jgi:RNA polymerase sigma-70 factor (ECF subfamily)